MFAARLFSVRLMIRGTSAVAGVILGATLLAGCGEEAPREPRPDPSDAPSASAEPTDDPSLIVDGTASENLPYFDLVNSRLLAEGVHPGGREIIDNLVASGFDRAAMQLTPDKTSIGRDVDSLQFAVKWGEDCLIGQTSDAGYVGIVGPATGATGCLIGTTRTIDW
ncbi:MAG TPA: hypothetical protein VGP10_03600 [Marisediminicola sp.]|jgi:hypothetical protein|nr:hypothetical protein [Marisediminicola sp.]